MSLKLLTVFFAGYILTACLTLPAPIVTSQNAAQTEKPPVISAPSETRFFDETARPTFSIKGIDSTLNAHLPTEAVLSTKPSNTPTSSPYPLPEIISNTNLPCIQQGNFAKCRDEILNIEFEYPIAWGEINAVLRTGGYSGYAYDYYFGGRTMAESEPLMAGGRSIDFSEGRGGMPTDFWGFGGIDSQDRCSQVRNFYPICWEVDPGVYWMERFPGADYFCDQLPVDEIERFTFQPVVRIEIDLAQNVKVNGFVFEAPFLSNRLSQEIDRDFFTLLGITSDTAPPKCDSKSRAAFDLAVKDFAYRVESNKLDDETLKNLSDLMRLAASITISPVSQAALSEVDQVIFSIPNTEPWLGREGEPRPDWKGWGAETFTIAPDGTFWIADTSVYPNRLLQISPQGLLLQEISLKDRVAFVYNLVVTHGDIWILDISPEQPRVVQFSLRGDFLSSVDIPKESMMQDGIFIGNGAFDLIPGENGELLLNTINGYYEMVDATGEYIFQPVNQLTYYGHTFQVGRYDPATGKLPIYIDGALFEPPEDFFIEPESFSGFNSDGSFALAGFVMDPDGQADRQVRYYDVSGMQLGMVRQYPQTFYKDWNHHLAFDPNGAIYQLLSNPDHSVQILRLGFKEQLPTPTAAPALIHEQLTALQAIEPATSDEEQARNSLINFFGYLSQRNYDAAAALFEGQVDDYLRDPLPNESIQAYWEYLCAYLWCLPVAEITEVEMVSEGEYLFFVVFVNFDGTRFEIGACCGGDPAATPPVWQFAYPVQKIDGIWKVMRAPLFTP